MKNILKYLVVGIICLFPLVTSAMEIEINGVTYEAENLEEALDNEGIKADLSNYKETDDQAVIYLFRRSGCSHCYDFLTFLSELQEEYGEYFKLVSFETSTDSNNRELFSQVASLYGENGSAVPFIVIGEKSWLGYGDSMDQQIINEIVNEFEKSEDEQLNLESKLLEGPEEKDNTTALLVFSGFIILVIAGIVIIRNKTKEN